MSILVYLEVLTQHVYVQEILSINTLSIHSLLRVSTHMRKLRQRVSMGINAQQFPGVMVHGYLFKNAWFRSMRVNWKHLNIKF